MKNKAEEDLKTLEDVNKGIKKKLEDERIIRERYRLERNHAENRVRQLKVEVSNIVKDRNQAESESKQAKKEVATLVDRVRELRETIKKKDEKIDKLEKAVTQNCLDETIGENLEEEVDLEKEDDKVGGENVTKVKQLGTETVGKKTRSEKENGYKEKKVEINDLKKKNPEDGVDEVPLDKAARLEIVKKKKEAIAADAKKEAANVKKKGNKKEVAGEADLTADSAIDTSVVKKDDELVKKKKEAITADAKEGESSPTDAKKKEAIAADANKETAVEEVDLTADSTIDTSVVEGGEKKKVDATLDVVDKKRKATENSEGAASKCKKSTSTVEEATEADDYENLDIKDFPSDEEWETTNKFKVGNFIITNSKNAKESRSRTVRLPSRVVAAAKRFTPTSVNNGVMIIALNSKSKAPHSPEKGRGICGLDPFCKRKWSTGDPIAMVFAFDIPYHPRNESEMWVCAHHSDASVSGYNLQIQVPCKWPVVDEDDGKDVFEELEEMKSTMNQGSK